MRHDVWAVALKTKNPQCSTIKIATGLDLNNLIN